MSTKRIVVQAVTAAVLFFVIKLILEQNTDAGTLKREGITALFFGLAYGLYLAVRRWLANRNSD